MVNLLNDVGHEGVHSRGHTLTHALGIFWDAIHYRVENGLKGDDGKAVSAEAIKDEFLKGIKSTKSPAGFLELYDHFGLLSKYIFPGLHVDQARPNSHNPILVIAGLLHKNSPESIARRLLELKYSNDEVNKVVYLV